MKADQRTRGRYLGGIRPFGFTIGADGGLVEDPAEQKAIKRMVALRRKGKPLRAIAAALEAQGVKLTAMGVSKVLARVEARDDAAGEA